MKATQKEFDEYCRTYDTFIQKHYPEFKEGWQIFQELAEKVIHEKSVVLNVGAGHDSCIEKSLSRAKKVFALDPDKHALSNNKHGYEKIVGQAEAIPLPDASVDVVVLEWVLEHIQDPQQSFKEISRVLKPNGVILFCTPNMLNPAIFLFSIPKKLSNHLSQKMLSTALMDREEEDVYPVFYRANTLRRLKYLLKKSGLTLDELETTGCPGYFRFSKPLLWLSVFGEKISAKKPFRWTQAYFLATAKKI